MEIGPQPTNEYWNEQRRLCNDPWYLYTWFMIYPDKKYWSREDFNIIVDTFNNGPASYWMRSRVNFPFNPTNIKP
jgi:hypothetical protein